MKNFDEIALLTEIARLYYNEYLTQSQIAKRLNLSRSSISKALTKARSVGIVKIVIHDEGIRINKHLEHQLIEKFQLKEVVCVNAEYEEQTLKGLSIEAGKILARKMLQAKVVAVSGGRTIYNVADYFSSSVPFDNVTFVPISGGLGAQHRYMQAGAICEMFAYSSGANFLQLHAPVVVDSQESQKMLLKQRFIKEVMDKAREADIALVGIGSANQYLEWVETYLNLDDYNPKELRKIFKGDISYNLYDKKGNTPESKWHERLISLTLDEITNIPEVIAVASGMDKIESINIALKHRLVDCLITDVNTGKKLLNS